ncbi:hypothetical protein PLEOSDRAFT_1095009 [Pleurotus ostreatus PC15]|uniref:Endoplasmic reticulum junction formation protein lunapark n=1 Tax=Pleurotus ostreatus (strain PC15) TaxID=1137138 RepID=A0A067N3H5_PLEO1|nr:hypothetical protein PLEOSDRAFT_1095009 [Pleurotus ostreatus PC15]
MSFLLRLFKQSKEEDYETILSTLSRDVQSRQQKLADIRLRERRSTLWSTLYTAAAYVVYVCLWYFQALTLPRGVALAPVVVGPLIVLFIRRIVQLWYSRKEANEEKTLQHLLKQQRTKVEEIKKKTNYYSTRDLLSKYDESTPLNTPPPPQGLRQRLIPAPGQTPGTPNNGGPHQALASTSGPNGRNPGPPALIHPALNALSPSPFLATPTRKQWYDKLADALLGADDQAPPSSRYALICEKCFKHNGLLPEAMWEDAQFRCIKCDHLNASVRSKREARRSVSPGAASVDGSVSAPRTPSPMRNTAGRAPSSAASSPAASPPRSTADASRDIADRMDED